MWIYTEKMEEVICRLLEHIENKGSEAAVVFRRGHPEHYVWLEGGPSRVVLTDDVESMLRDGGEGEYGIVHSHPDKGGEVPVWLAATLSDVDLRKQLATASIGLIASCAGRAQGRWDICISIRRKGMGSNESGYQRQIQMLLHELMDVRLRREKSDENGALRRRGELAAATGQALHQAGAVDLYPAGCNRAIVMYTEETLAGLDSIDWGVREREMAGVVAHHERMEALKSWLDDKLCVSVRT